jgi:hypothetical protein
MNNQQPLTTLTPRLILLLQISIAQNPGNLYVSDSEESSEDDELDDHEEAFSSPGGRALSPEVSFSDIVIEYAVLKHCNIEHGPGVYTVHNSAQQQRTYTRAASCWLLAVNSL